VKGVEQSGQQYLPVYLLAPFRIIVTFIGVVLAFIFTIFPYPVTSKDILRQDIAKQFQLLSRITNLTDERMREIVNSEESQGLKELMRKVGSKCIAVHTRCLENLRYSSWEPNLQHRFPKEVYSDLLSSMRRYSLSFHVENSLFELYVAQNMAISQMTESLLNAMSDSQGTTRFQSHSHLMLSLYHTLSGSLSLDIPLPPFLNTPQGPSFPILIRERLPEKLELKHMGPNGYAVFAALEVTSGLASWEIQRCVDLVRSLVGEADLQW
jgi:hypothetical protein